jgi:hypothetical protein
VTGLTLRTIRDVARGIRVIHASDMQRKDRLHYEQEKSRIQEDSARHHHGVIPLAASPVTLALSWKRDADSVAAFVAVMRLDLLQLLSDGLIRLERPGEVRVRFVHSRDGRVLLQVNQQGPSVTIGQV